MRITLKLDPLFRSKIDTEGPITLDLPDGATVADCLAAMAARWPDLEPMLAAPAVPYSLFVNSRIVPRGRRGSFPLKDGDTLYLFEPVAGG
ncbi:MAG: MoaD/ThiS family protein [Anaerolineae bacterium]